MTEIFFYFKYYYKDLQIFTKDQLVNDEEFGFFILGERDKNGNDTIIPLFKFPHAIAIIKTYAADNSSPLIFIISGSFLFLMTQHF